MKYQFVLWIRKHYKKFLALTMILSLLGFSFYSLWNSGFFLVKNIQIVIFNEMEQKDFFAPLRQVLQNQLSDYAGKSIFDVPFDQIQKKLLKTKWIKSARLYRQWPNQLQVEIQSKELVFLLKSKHKEWIPVVADGSMLDSVSSNSLPDIPIVNQEMFEKDLSLRTKLINVMQEIPKQGVFSRENISDAGYDTQDGFWVSMIANETKIKLGNDNYNLKSERLSQVIEYLNHRELKARVIDANFNKKVLVRLRKDP